MILITGATGLVGSHLTLQLLLNGQSVAAIYRTNESVNKTRHVFALYKQQALFERIHWIQADITDVPSLETAFQDIDVVYHCAAHVSFDPADEEIMRKVNIEGTANVVNFCLEYGVSKLCHVSSIAALGDLKEGVQIITEDTEWNPEMPHSDYAISKYGAEMEIWRGQQEGLAAVIVNPGVILGPCFWESGSGEIFTRVARGLPFYTQGVTGFTTVKDVVTIMIRLMESDVSGERFIVVNKNASFAHIVQTIARALGVKPPSVEAKPWMTAIAWRLDYVASLLGKKRTLTRSMVRAMHHQEHFSSQRVGFALYHTFADLDAYIARIAAHYPKKIT